MRKYYFTANKSVQTLNEIAAASFFFFFFFFGLFSAASMAYGGSLARGQIRAVAAGLCHKHSNMGSKSHLRPTPHTAHGNTGSLTH